jgi:hypothetical protein
MDKLQEREMEVCSQCKASEKIESGYCTLCGAPVYPLSATNWRAKSQQSHSGYLRLAVYFTAAITFTLGILDGFLDYNSSAMAINLLLSLVVLSLASRVQENPVWILSICITLNLASHTLFPLFDVFELRRWSFLKLLLAIVPIMALLRLKAARLFP